MTFKVISQRNSGSKADRARMIASLWVDEGVVRYYEIIQGPKETVRIRATDEALKFVEFLKACGASIEPDYDVQFEDRMNKASQNYRLRIVVPCGSRREARNRILATFKYRNWECAWP